MGRFWLAVKAFFRILRDKAFAAGVEDLLTGGKRKAAPETLPREAAQLLGILQRDGRLIDFLMESIDGYPDAQVGAMAKQIQKGCRKVLDDYITIEPVRTEEESSTVMVEKDFDPCAQRLIGNVVGDPPFTGLLRHHGWKAVSIRLPKPPAEGDPSIVAPAEIEIP
jgi:hypothetical protein